MCLSCILNGRTRRWQEWQLDNGEEFVCVVCGSEYSNSLAQDVAEEKRIEEAEQAAQKLLAEEAQEAFRAKFKKLLTSGMDMSLAVAEANKTKDAMLAEGWKTAAEVDKETAEEKTAEEQTRKTAE